MLARVNESYFYDREAVNDNGVMVPVFVGFDLTGWVIKEKENG